jgi:hypothetical protein
MIAGYYAIIRNTRNEDFTLGIFNSAREAQQAIDKYLADFPRCGFRIVAVAR